MGLTIMCCCEDLLSTTTSMVGWRLKQIMENNPFSIFLSVLHFHTTELSWPSWQLQFEESINGIYIEMDSSKLNRMDFVLKFLFKGFQFLYKKGFQHFRTLIEWRITGIIVTTVVKYFGHVFDKVS